MPEDQLRAAVAGRRWRVLAVLVTGLVAVAADTAVLAVALPAVRADLGGSIPALQWVVLAAVVPTVALTPLAGRCAHRVGVRRLLLGGLGLLVLAALLAAAAVAPGQLIAARVLTGLGGAAVLGATLELVDVVYAGGDRARAVGVCAGFGGLIVAIAPPLAGVLVDVTGWQAVVLVPAGFALVAAAGLLRLLPAALPSPARLMLRGPLLGTAALVAGLLAATGPLALPARLTAGVLSVGLAGALAVVGGRPRPLRPRQLRPRLLVTALVSFGLAGATLLLTVQWQLQEGYSGAGTGLRLLSLSGGVAAAGATQRWWRSRRPAAAAPRFAVLGGLLLAAAALAGLGTAGPRLVVVLVLGVGLGLAAVPPGAVSAARQLGAVAGVALVGAPLGLAPTLTGTAPAGLVGAGVLLAGAAVTVGWPRARRLPAYRRAVLSPRVTTAP